MTNIMNIARINKATANLAKATSNILPATKGMPDLGQPAIYAITVLGTIVLTAISLNYDFEGSIDIKAQKGSITLRKHD